MRRPRPAPYGDAVRRLLLAVGGAVVLVAGVPVAAAAHTTLVAQTPKANATVASPSAVTLTFADRVIQPGIVVRSAAGKRVDGGARPDGRKVIAPLPKHLAAGRYQVGWRVVAPDGHVQTGEFRFAVPDSSGKVPAGPAGDSGGSGPPAWLWVAIAGAVVLVAGGLYAVRRAVR